MAEDALSASEVKGLESILEKRLGKLKIITVESSSRALIVRTDEPNARALRTWGGITVSGGKRLEPILTSGAIGKLKKRVGEATINGKIHER